VNKKWEMFSLEQLGKITSSKRIFKSEYVDTGIPFYRTKEIKELANGLKVSTELYISKDRFNEINRKFGTPAIGDLLITAIGTIGEIYVVDNTNFYFKDGNVLWLRDFRDIDPDFLKYSLMAFVDELNTISHGSAYQALPIEKLKKHRLLKPPLAEQKRIVAILDEAFEGIDRAIAIAEKNLANVRELFESYLNSIFTQKGDGWVEKKLDEECEIIMGQSPDGSSYNSEGLGVPLINGPVEFGGIEPFSKTVATKFTTEPTKMCKEGDLILCVRGSTTGRMNIAGQEACIGRGVSAIRSKNNQDWVNHFISFSRHKIYESGSGSTFPNVSSSELKKIIVPFPPKEQQDYIVSQIKYLSTETQRLEAIYRKKIAALKELKQSILQKAFTGELTADTVEKAA